MCPRAEMSGAMMMMTEVVVVVVVSAASFPQCSGGGIDRGNGADRSGPRPAQMMSGMVSRTGQRVTQATRGLGALRDRFGSDQFGNS